MLSSRFLYPNMSLLYESTFNPTIISKNTWQVSNARLRRHPLGTQGVLPRTASFIPTCREGEGVRGREGAPGTQVLAYRFIGNYRCIPACF